MWSEESRLYMYTYRTAGNFGEHYIWRICFKMVLTRIKFGELNVNALFHLCSIHQIYHLLLFSMISEGFHPTIVARLFLCRHFKSMAAKKSMWKISAENMDSAMIIIILTTFKFGFLPQIHQSAKLKPSPKFPAIQNRICNRIYVYCIYREIRLKDHLYKKKQKKLKKPLSIVTTGGCSMDHLRVTNAPLCMTTCLQRPPYHLVL